MVHDFYYPYVGLENHAAARAMRHRIGVWVENKFSWLDDGSWNTKQVYESEALIGITTATCEWLGITLKFYDCIDSEYDAFLRSVEIINYHGQEREIRLFMHQVFLISNSLSGDTAQYLPGEAAILNYKGHRAFVIGTENHKGQTFDQYAIGVYGIEGKDGTFRDAEDGELSGNAVEHGSVDSIVRHCQVIEAHGSARVHYWVACGKAIKSAVALHHEIVRDGVQYRQNITEQSWRHWLGKSEVVRKHIPEEYKDSFTKSLLITKSHIDSRGGVIASTDTTMLNYWRDAYTYAWPRDGALSLWPLLRLGYYDELQRFFEFCRRGLSTDGFLAHKYQADGAIGSSWHPYVYAGKPEPPIQEDETAIVLFLCGEYYRQTNDKFFLNHYYASFIKPMAHFLATYIDNTTKLPRASYDLWEQTFLTTTYSTATVYGALKSAVELAEENGDKQSAISWQVVADDIHVAAHEKLYNKERKFFYRGLRVEKGGSIYHDETIDVSSFYGAFMFGLFPLYGDEVKQSFESLGQRFNISDNPNVVTPMPRYEGDDYLAVAHGEGNPWFVTTTWLAQYYLETKQYDRARAIVRWVRDSMMPSGVLAEQINPRTGQFVSVAPLTWSQAEYMNVVLDMVAMPEGNSDEIKTDVPSQ